MPEKGFGFTLWQTETSASGGKVGALAVKKKLKF
jgi:hypothetical protein